jgi:hypothetical protein
MNNLPASDAASNYGFVEGDNYTDFHGKLPFWELDYTASLKCRYQSRHSVDNQALKKKHLMKSV